MRFSAGNMENSGGKTQDSGVYPYIGNIFSIDYPIHPIHPIHGMNLELPAYDYDVSGKGGLTRYNPIQTYTNANAPGGIF